MSKVSDKMNDCSKQPGSKNYIVPSVERAIRITEYLETSTAGASLGDISNQLNIPKSTAFRILRTMTHFGYVEQDEERGTFSLGSRILVLANSIKDKIDVVKKAIPHMERLTRNTGETCKLGVVRNDELIVVHKIESLREMSARTDIMGRFPLHAGAASKLLLAHLPPAEIERYIQNGLASFTPNTIKDPYHLRRQLQEIRKRGFAVDNEEYVLGIKAFACPVYDLQAKVVAALSIPYLATATDVGREAELLSQLIQAALDVSRSLGYTPLKSSMATTKKSE